MNFSDFITNSGKRVRKEAFVHLVLVSKTDGKIQKEELELLHRQGKKFGLTDPEIDKLINSEKDNRYTPPYSLEDKFYHLYNVAEMILADKIIKETEIKMIRRFAIEAGFKDSAKIDDLIAILFEGIERNTEEDQLLKKFKKRALH
jgi:uncharacterized tellurite resistance protein B-like protein